MRRTGLACVVVVLSLTGVASAQMPPPADTPIDPAPPPPPEPEPPPPVATTPAPAPVTPAATPQENAPLGSAIGIGVHAMLGNLSLGAGGGSIAGPVGPSFVYNGGRFHVEGILAYQDVDGGTTTLAIAGRGWYHVHESPGATLSVGGGLGFVNSEIDNGTTSTDFSLTVIEAGAQIRFFVTRNVALSANLGLSILSGENDADALIISGQLTGGLGLTYFIF